MLGFFAFCLFVVVVFWGVFGVFCGFFWGNVGDWLVGCFGFNVLLFDFVVV